MDPQAGASFISKKPLAEQRARAGGMGLVVLAAILFFAASIAAAGAVFAYQRFLASSIADKSEDLELAQGAYGPETINDLTQLDSRIIEASALLQSHISPSAIFSLLSLQTLSQVRFNSFEYQMAADGSASVAMSGVANSFSTLALQSDQLGASKSLKDIVFSEIEIDPMTSEVKFSVEATVDSSLILYSNSLAQDPAEIAPQEAATQSVAPIPTPADPVAPVPAAPAASTTTLPAAPRPSAPTTTYPAYPAAALPPATTSPAAPASMQ